jgi:hypothetical protein
MRRIRHTGLIAALAIATFAATLAAQLPTPLPLKYSGPPTVPAITPGDLMTRLYIIADDSMMGREIGTVHHLQATAYVAGEAQRLGLVPLGDSGTFFQRVPVVRRAFDTTSTLTTDSAVYHGGSDFLATVNAQPWQFAHAEALYGGVTYDTTNLLSADLVRGKFLLLTAPPPGTLTAALARSTGYRNWLRMVAAAAAVATIGPMEIPAPMLRVALHPTGMSSPPDTTREMSFLVREGVARALLGQPAGPLVKGTVGRPVTSSVHFDDAPLPGRNVLAMIRGSDPALAGEYVVLATHTDNLGPFNPRDHDSVRVANEVLRPEGARSPVVMQPSNAQWERIFARLDSVRKIRPPRPDSIYNGADDDGSGIVSLLEIAEAIAHGGTPPRRSIIFAWFGGEEPGNWGSARFTDHPPVPRDSIVAAISVDRVGRGDVTDETGHTAAGSPINGSEGYLQVVGSRRMSGEFGNLIDAVNTAEHPGAAFDYSMDGNPRSVYCSGETAAFAFGRYGIPAVEFTTGVNVDFHQVTDEAQYIDYSHMARVDSVILAVTRAVADLAHRPVIDQPAPPLHAACKP